jgi:hypothetical protein
MSADAISVVTPTNASAGAEARRAGTLWVVSPVYYDAEAYRILRSHFAEVLRSLSHLDGWRFRFVVIDDSAGVDAAMEPVRQLPDTRVFTPPFNLGHQRAIVFGVRRLIDDIEDDDLVLTMDSDGEDKPEDVPALLAPLLARPGVRNRVALARRTKRSESLAFKVLYSLFKILFRSLTGTIIQSGNFAVYRGWVATNVLFHPHFDLCYSSSLIGLNLALDLVPCARGHRYAGQSKMSPSKLIAHGIRMLMPFMDRVATRSMISFSILFFLGVLVSVGVLGSWAVGWQGLPAGAPLVALVLIGLSFVSLGNFVLLFALFAQHQSISLSNIERYARQAGPRSGVGDN